MSYEGRTPNYILTKDVFFNSNGVAGSWGDGKTATAGTFVRPIEPTYVPAHVVEKWKPFNPSTQVYVYCSFGIIVVPKEAVRET